MCFCNFLPHPPPTQLCFWDVFILGYVNWLINFNHHMVFHCRDYSVYISIFLLRGSWDIYISPFFFFFFLTIAGTATRNTLHWCLCVSIGIGYVAQRRITGWWGLCFCKSTKHCHSALQLILLILSCESFFFFTSSTLGIVKLEDVCWFVECEMNFHSGLAFHFPNF